MQMLSDCFMYSGNQFQIFGYVTTYNLLSVNIGIYLHPIKVKQELELKRGSLMNYLSSAFQLSTASASNTRPKAQS